MKFGESFNRLLSIWLGIVAICVTFVIISRENQPTKQELVKTCIEDNYEYFHKIESLQYLYVRPDSIEKYLGGILDTANLHGYSKDDFMFCFGLLYDTAKANAFFANELICRKLTEKAIMKYTYVNGYIFSSISCEETGDVACVGFWNKTYIAKDAPWRIAYEETKSCIDNGTFFTDEAVEPDRFKNAAEETAYVYYMESLVALVYKDSLDVWKNRFVVSYY